MSVHAGIWNLDGDPVSRECLARVAQPIAGYGPDGETTYSDGAMGMLYRPFHTTSESRFEHQPFVSDSGKVFTWDGRLDNRDELMPQVLQTLRGDRTDVAIVAAAFDRWDKECLAKLVGDWGLAIWDSREQALILARDYMGIRQLFYHTKPKSITWCNHLAPLALSGDHFTLCDEYIAGFLASDPDAHLTPYREILSVPPGKCVRVHRGKITIHTHWTFNTRLHTRYKRDAEYEDQYRHLFRQAVRRRLRSASPVLADLSGGFDSSSIVCMADDILAKEGSETPRIDTFSFHDSNEPDEDDFLHFVKVEQKRGKTGFHADLQGSGDSFSLEYPVFVASPEGLGNRVEVKAALSDLLQQHEYRVLLCGRGGDEMNGQPLDPRVQMADLLLDLRLMKLGKQLVAWSLLIRKRPLIQLFLQTLLQLAPMPLRAALTEQGRPESWVNRTFAKKHRMSVRQMGAIKGASFLRPSIRDAIQTIDTLSRRMTSTRPSLVEKRYPYLDQHLVEFLSTIPLDQLLRPGQRRFLMRRALAGLLPVEILNRKTKASFDRSYSVTIAKHWNKLESAFASPLSSRLGYLDKDRIREALADVKAGHVSPFLLRLLNAVCLEYWLRDVVARNIVWVQPPIPMSVNKALVESGA
jgi:asparagine synthase (glutamine-hydrolysing)